MRLTLVGIALLLCIMVPAPAWAAPVTLTHSGLANNPNRFLPSEDGFLNLTARSYCSQEEKDFYIAMAEGQLRKANEAADRATAYFEQLVLRIVDERRDGNDAHADADQRTLDDFKAHEGKVKRIDDPAAATRQLDRLKYSPVHNCGTTSVLEGRRPVPLPVDIPSFDRNPCTQDEIDALVAKLDAAGAAASRNSDDVADYTANLQRMIGEYQTRLSKTPDSADIIYRLNNELAAYLELKLFTTYSSLADTARRGKQRALLLKPVPCGDQTRTIPFLTPSAFAVPPRPTLMLDSITPPIDRRLCAESDRKTLLASFDTVIKAANADIQAANAHMEELAKLSADAHAADAKFGELRAINDEVRDYKDVVTASTGQAFQLVNQRAAVAQRPLDSCSAPQTGTAPPIAPSPPTSDGPVRSSNAGGGKAACPPKRGRVPIRVGSNGRVGSGARAAKKAVDMLAGLVGGMLGGGGGGGSGSGPRVASCHMKNSEKTVFTDPETGISLRVGATRSGDSVTVFADIANSPDSGTFQTALAETADGSVQAPERADICELWGEWSLSVSWTRTEYVNDQVVSRSSGGYSQNGTFSLPGMISSDEEPAGLWKQLGFSNASHGARGVALRYKLPKAENIAPVTLLLHVTRPSLDLVTTQPFALIMREGEAGFTFAKEEKCPEEESSRPAPPTH